MLCLKKNGLTAHNLHAIKTHMTPIEEGSYASNDSPGRGAAEPAAKVCIQTSLLIFASITVETRGERLFFELLYPFSLNWSIKNPIPLFEKWGFHDLAILAPPKIGKEKAGRK
jgi:hypothetical protein